MASLESRLHQEVSGIEGDPSSAFFYIFHEGKRLVHQTVIVVHLVTLFSESCWVGLNYTGGCTLLNMVISRKSHICVAFAGVYSITHLVVGVIVI